MLRFVNIQKDLPYLELFGISDILFGVQYSPNDKPLDFQYQSSNDVTKFEAVKINPRKEIIDTISLSTSLVTLDAGRHICTGQVNFAENLPEGLYYFNVNDQYYSELFIVTYEIRPNYLELEQGGFLELELGGFLELEN